MMSDSGSPGSKNSLGGCWAFSSHKQVEDVAVKLFGGEEINDEVNLLNVMLPFQSILGPVPYL